jgi:Sulfotransferase domain
VIVWIASFPRSGNNLFREALYRIFGVKSGSVFPEPLGADPFLDDVSLHLPEDSIDSLRELEAPVFVKTHRLSEADDPSPAVYLVRDGRDAYVSYAHFVRARGERAFTSLDYEGALATLIGREDHAYGSWSASVRAWTRRTGPTVIVRFEELVENPHTAVRDAAKFLGIPLGERVGGMPSFRELHAQNPIVFRRGEVGSWRSELPPELEERFWRLHGAQMLALGYPRRHPLVAAPS